MITTGSNRTFIEAEQYSDFILRVLPEMLLPETFYRNVSDFGMGDVLNIKTVGEATVQEVTEDTPLTYEPIETGEVQLRITDYKGDAWYVTDVMRQDGAQIDQLLSIRGEEASRALAKNMESRSYATLNDGQTANDPNVINDQPHRFVATGTNATIEIADIIKMKLAFDKANVPYGSRVVLIDPIVEATMNLKFQGVYNVDSNNEFQDILEGGFGRDHMFVMHFMGFHFMTTNLLPRVATETIDAGDGDVTVTDGVANIFMSVMSDQHKPLMYAERQAPRTEGERNKDRQRDEYVVTARWGLGIQRVDTLGVILTSSTAIS